MALENILTFFLQQRVDYGRLRKRLWWKYAPGVKVKVRWPKGPIMKDFADQYKTNEELFSSDPNDHYRPWLEKEVGRQGISWDWELEDSDTTNNTLTIKFLIGNEQYASMAALKWK